MFHVIFSYHLIKNEILLISCLSNKTQQKQNNLKTTCSLAANEILHAIDCIIFLYFFHKYKDIKNISNMWKIFFSHRFNHACHEIVPGLDEFSSLDKISIIIDAWSFFCFDKLQKVKCSIFTGELHIHFF